MVNINNVINISVSQSPRGLGNYNVNNLMYLTDAQPITDWGTDAYRAYTTATEVATDFGTDSKPYKDAVAIFSQSPSILAGGGNLIIAPLGEEGAETLSNAINRLSPLVYWGGIISSKAINLSEVKAAAQLNDSMDSIMFVYSNDAATLDSGLLKDIADLNLNNTKLLLYTAETEDAARLMACAYASRGMSVNFSAQNSTITMNLKDLSGIAADTAITQTIYNKCATMGVDIYTSFNGLAKVISNGKGAYFDDMFNRLWFKQKLKVEMFNSLATTATKIPQTEQGMNKIKSSARQVCDMAVYNGFCAPGKWNGADTFGNQEDFLRNIQDFGYYVYSRPVSEQSQTDRESRKAPVIQVAVKQAGAIHKIDLIINFEA